MRQTVRRPEAAYCRPEGDPAQFEIDCEESVEAAAASGGDSGSDSPRLGGEKR